MHTPNQFRAVHDGVGVGSATVLDADVGSLVGAGTGLVVVTDGPVMVGSEVAAEVFAGVVALSLQPNQPGVLHVVLLVVVEELLLEVVVVVVVLSLQPNQPGVLHVLVVVVVVVLELVVVGGPVVVSSKHPHHPGVAHVSVRVCDVCVEVADEVVVVVVDSVPLLS